MERRLLEELAMVMNPTARLEELAGFANDYRERSMERCIEENGVKIRGDLWAIAQIWGPRWISINV